MLETTARARRDAATDDAAPALSAQAADISDDGKEKTCKAGQTCVAGLVAALSRAMLQAASLFSLPFSSHASRTTPGLPSRLLLVRHAVFQSAVRVMRRQA